MNFNYGRRMIDVLRRSDDTDKTFHNLHAVPDDIVAAMPPRERVLHDRNQRIGKLVRYAPTVGFIAGMLVHTGRLMSIVHLGFAFGGMGLGWLVVYVNKLIAGRMTVTRVDQNLTFRAEQFARSMGTRVDAVRIDESGAGLTRHFYYRQGTKIVVSSMTRMWMSREEMDFILAAAVTHADVKQQKTWDMWSLRALPYVIALILAPALVLPFIPHQVFLLNGPYIILGIPAYVLVIGGILMGSLKWELSRRMGTRSKRIDDTVEGDRKALALTGNREAAISALVKLSQAPPVGGGTTFGDNVYITQTSLMLRITKLRQAEPVSPPP